MENNGSEASDSMAPKFSKDTESESSENDIK